MTSHEKRVSALMRLHGMTKAAAEKRAKQIEKVGGSTSKYVSRPSKTTGRAPSARLVARRKKTMAGPKGYFANPEPRKQNPVKPGITARPVKGKRRAVFAVEYANSEKGPWATAGIFANRQLASDYANSMADVNPSKWFRVVLK